MSNRSTQLSLLLVLSVFTQASEPPCAQVMSYNNSDYFSRFVSPLYSFSEGSFEQFVQDPSSFCNKMQQESHAKLICGLKADQSFVKWVTSNPQQDFYNADQYEYSLEDFNSIPLSRLVFLVAAYDARREGRSFDISYNEALKKIYSELCCPLKRKLWDNVAINNDLGYVRKFLQETDPGLNVMCCVECAKFAILTSAIYNDNFISWTSGIGCCIGCSAYAFFYRLTDFGKRLRRVKADNTLARQFNGQEHTKID